MDISKLYLIMLRRITKEIVIQGIDHKENIIEYYRIINKSAQNEFTEDNKYILDNFLKDCHKSSLEQKLQSEV